MARPHVCNYASSSDSDSEPSLAALRRRRRRRRHRNHTQTPAPKTVGPTPQSSPTTSAEGKKKESQKTAQEGIDSIWEKFSQKRFSKALAVLPFSPVQASTSCERGNELLQAGYERAAEECRRKVRKIITECKRVNTRYRDPGWDLDWDFKQQKGHTLNSLIETRFDISPSNLADPAAIVPKAVKRVHEIFEHPTFMENILPGDIKQGNLGDCWFVASLTGLANVPGGVKRICVEYDTKIGIYGFVFYRDGQWIYSIIDDKLFLKSPCWDSPSMQRDLLQLIDREDVERVYRQTYQTGSQALFFAQNKHQNETWVPLVEKAYAKAHGDFACLAGGWIGEALEDLSGGVTTELLASDIFDTDAFWTNELSKVNHEFLFGCSTGLLDGGYGARDGITEGHAYVIMEARELKDGTRLCKLRNPWGKIRKGNWEGAWSDGSKEWTPEAQEELNHTFGSDSTFWIPYEDLLRKYLHFDRTRLFRDPDWRSCQRWIGVEVPWKPQYNEKFHIKLTKESPVVLVLSQLDDRYFRGLEGQYNFRLQFRLHEEGRPGAEEYIVRSHGNYLMERSVSIELPTMSPGDYVVYISISGERDASVSSTEDVVRYQCKGREENEKLAQVGQAYDLAHAKAASHLDRLSKIRKKAESKEASESRRKDRRQHWQKRQIGRAVAQKQNDKNAAKKAERKRRKIAKAEAEAKEAALKEAEGRRCKIAKAEAEAKEAALKEVEGKAQQSESQPTDKSVQTDPDPSKEGGSQSEIGIDGTLTTSTSSSSAGNAQCTPRDSPQSQVSVLVEGQTAKVDMPPAQELVTAISSAPPPQTAPISASSPSLQLNTQQPLELKFHYCSCSSCKPPAVDEGSDGYSSDSPVEDYELLYDEDDLTPNVRLAGAPETPVSESGQDSDDEDTPGPWNAIAVVGFRVYSKDEGLELRVVMEGGELDQDGMGNHGEADLDNAVTNAAGLREKKEQSPESLESGMSSKGEAHAKDPSNETAKSKVKITAPDAGDASREANSTGQQGDDTTLASDKAPHRTIVERKTSEFDRAMGNMKVGQSDKEAPAKDSSINEALSKDSTSTQHQSIDQHTVTKNEHSQEASPLPVKKGSMYSENPVGDITETVLSIRSKLQNGCRKLLMQAQMSTKDDLQEMSDYLAKLESYPDLEASVILSTKIHKVMLAIVKLDRLSKDDGSKLSIESRAQALLDDYELTLMTS